MRRPAPGALGEKPLPREKQFDVEEVPGKVMQADRTLGYEATSMRHLVDRTGINRGSLNATCGDQRALFHATLRCYAETMRMRMLAEPEKRLGPLGRAGAPGCATIPPAAPARGGTSGPNGARR